MKKIIILLFALAAISCTELGRIDQVDNSDYIPAQVTVKSVRSLSGGAVIRYALPEDVNLRGVRAEYERAGETVFTQVSKYVDSLKVDGFSDTESHEVLLYSVGKNNRLSAPVSVDVVPGLPPLKKVKMSLKETFGGIRLLMEGNVDNAALAITILQDSNLDDFGNEPSDMEWEEVFTYYTSGPEASFTRYGLDTQSRIYGVYARDRWLNYSDTVYFKLTPLEEESLPSSFWKEYYLPGDETEWLEGKYDFKRLWDGAWDSNTYSAGFSRGPRRKTYTIDMGYVASFSRMRMQPRTSTGNLGSGYVPWRWQIWGSMDPSPSGQFDDSWYLLGDFTQKKLSGLDQDGSLGTITAEDAEYFKNTNDYEFLQTDEILDPQRETHFIRLVLLDSVTSYFTEYEEEPNNILYVIGELMFWGKKQ